MADNNVVANHSLCSFCVFFFCRAHRVCLTSANMSKAAWGALQKEGGQLMVRNFEIGVLFVPSRFAPHLRLVAGSAPSLLLDASKAVVPLPHELQPLLPYNSSSSSAAAASVRGGHSEDRPWVWDKAYPEPDSKGMPWRT